MARISDYSGDRGDVVTYWRDEPELPGCNAYPVLIGIIIICVTNFMLICETWKMSVLECIVIEVVN